MSAYTDRELDRILDEFLGVGPVSAPDDAIEAALAELDGVRRRRRPLLARADAGPAPVRTLLAAALVLLLLIAGAIWVGSRPAEPTVVPSLPAVTAPVPVSTADTAPALSPAPSPLPTPLASLESGWPQIGLARAALGEVDAAIEGARGEGGPVSDAQLGLFRITDEIRAPLQGRNNPAAIRAFEPLPSAAAEVAVSLDDVPAARLLDAVAALGGALRAVPFSPGELPAGAYHSTAFDPAIALTLPAGWSRGVEDSELLVLRSGEATLGISKMALETTEAGIANALGRGSPDDLETPVRAVSLGTHDGFVAEMDGGGTLWYTAAMVPFDAGPDDRTRAWVLEAVGRAITFELVGPPAEVDRRTPEVEAILRSLVATTRATSGGAY